MVALVEVMVVEVVKVEMDLDIIEMVVVFRQLVYRLG